MLIGNELKSLFEQIVEGRLDHSNWLAALQTPANRAIFEKMQHLANSHQFSFETLAYLPLIFSKIAFIQPEDIGKSLDTLSESWLASQTLPLPVLPLQTHKVPAKVWEFFWLNVETPGAVEYLDIAAQFFGLLDRVQQEKYANIMLGLPGMAQVITENYQASAYTLESLKAYQAGSFGHAFYRQMVENSLTLEDLDVDKYAWCNIETEIITRRLARTHDIWHVLLNYSANGYDEVALQAVNLSQTGRAFSAFLLASLVTRYVLLVPSLLTELLEIIFKGWQTGRQNPPLLPVHWEEFWGVPLEEVRRKFGIRPSFARYSAKIKV